MQIKSVFKNIREYENLHIALWLIKDTCWCMSERLAFLKPVGMFMIVPTLVVAVDLAWKSRKNTADLFHNIAICLWISANATWMTGEFFYEDTFRDYAMVFFAAGLFVVALYYIIHFPKRNKEVGE